MTELERENLISRNRKIIEIVMKEMNDKCPGSVDMIGIGGSFCNGDIYEKSDLDLVIISNDDKAGCLNQCFILGDVAMDVYTHDWSSFEKMAEYNHPYVTKLIDLDIIYVHDEDVMGYYKKLQGKLRENMNNDLLIFENVKKHFSKAKLELVKLNKNDSDLGIAYRALGNIVREVEFVIYMMNKSYVKRGTKRVPEEICSMDLLPDGFKDIYSDITNCHNIEEVKDKCNKLVSIVGEFLSSRGIEAEAEEEEKEVVETVDRNEVTASNLRGTYEEIYSNWKNKMYHAVSINSRYLSFVTMRSCQEFYDDMFLAFQIPKIELIDYYNPDDLVNNAEKFDSCMEKWLELYKQVGLDVNFYADTKELEGMYSAKEKTHK